MPTPPQQPTRRTPRTPQPIRPGEAGHGGDDGGRPDGPVFLPPLRPNRPLLAVAAGLLAVWLGFLLYLYASAGGSQGAGPRPASAGPSGGMTQPATSPAELTPASVPR